MGPNNIGMYNLFLGRYVSKNLTEFIHFDFNEVINDWALYTTSFFFLTGSAAGPDISSKNNTSPQITSFDGRNLPSGFTLNRAKKLCFSLLTPVAKDILRRSGKLSFLLIWHLFYSNKYQISTT